MQVNQAIRDRLFKYLSKTHKNSGYVYLLFFEKYFVTDNIISFLTSVDLNEKAYISLCWLTLNKVNNLSDEDIRKAQRYICLYMQIAISQKSILSKYRIFSIYKYKSTDIINTFTDLKSDIAISTDIIVSILKEVFESNNN